MKKYSQSTKLNLYYLFLINFIISYHIIEKIDITNAITTSLIVNGANFNIKDIGV